MKADGTIKIDTRLDSSAFKAGLNTMKDLASKAASGTKTLMHSITVGFTAAVGAVSTASVALGKEVVSAYADYEQLVGGVDTLFKESSGKLQEYAAVAYKTAGVSANDYMDTVTSFSASLISSLGGDTKKAVEYADMAITDMADNANKMGTDMESIQNAYQGFAKQNYTMLDNLKLGYGGTKEEMARLLKDAEKLSGIKYDLSSFSDMVSAIHVIQENMDITGTTAKEAELTIAGAINTTKSAVQNLVAGLGNADADIDLLCGNVSDSFQNVVRNITPIVDNIVAVLPSAADAILSSAGNILLQVVSSTLESAPRFVDLGVKLATSLVEGLSKNSDSIIKAAKSAMSAFFEGIRSIAGQIVPLACEIIGLIVEGFISYYELIWTTGVELVTQLIAGIAKKAPDLFKSAQNAVTNIIAGLKKNLPVVLKAGIEVATQFMKSVAQMLPDLLKFAVEILVSLAEELIDNIDIIIEAAIECVSALADALFDALPILLEKLPAMLEKLVSGLVSGLLGNLDKVIEAGIKMIIALGEALCDPMELLKIAGSIISGLFAGLVNGLAGLVSGIFSAFNAEIEANADLSKAQAILEQEKAYNDELREAIKVREDLHKKAEEKVQDALTEEAMCQRLVAELEKVVDANGKVKEGYEGRVDFILNELNSALGTEYKRTGDVIDQYGNLTDSIEKVIKKKKAQILLEAYEEEYKNALKTQNDLLAQQVENEISLSEKQAEVSKLRAELADLEKQQKQALMAEDDKMIAKLYDEINAKEAVLKTTEETLLQVMDRHSAAEIAITQNYETIDKYESASAALLSDNAEKAAKILQGKSEAQEAYAGSVEQSVVRNKEALREEMDQAEVAYKQMKDRLDRHIAGVTQDMVDEYEQRYKDAKKAYRSLGEVSIDELNTAIESKNPFLQKQLKQLGVLSRSNIKKELDSTSIGVNFVDGIASGIENRKSSLFSRVTDFMNGIFSVARKVQDSHSPSRRAKKEIGEMWGAGVEEGVEASTQDTAEAASRQVNAMFEAATFDADRYATRLRNSVAFDAAHTAACVSNTVNYYNTSSVNESNTQSSGALVNIERVEINNDTDAEALGNELGFIISREDAFR